MWAEDSVRPIGKDEWIDQVMKLLLVQPLPHLALLKLTLVPIWGSELYSWEPSARKEPQAVDLKPFLPDARLFWRSAARFFE